MPLHVERGALDIERSRFEYLVTFDGQAEGESNDSVPAQVAISVSENGDLADLSFELPKLLRTWQATALIRKLPEARLVKTHVFVAVPGVSGDAVLPSSADLELDGTGRIVRVRVFAY